MLTVAIQAPSDLRHEKGFILGWYVMNIVDISVF